MMTFNNVEDDLDSTIEQARGAYATVVEAVNVDQPSLLRKFDSLHARSGNVTDSADDDRDDATVDKQEKIRIDESPALDLLSPGVVLLLLLDQPDRTMQRFALRLRAVPKSVRSSPSSIERGPLSSRAAHPENREQHWLR
jgi:hypothetical protein